MISPEYDPRRSDEKVGFRAKAVNYGRENWRWFIGPAALFGSLVYATYMGRATVDSAVDKVNGEEPISGLVVNRGTQDGLNQHVNPIECDLATSCPIDNTSFNQDKRYFVVINNCELVLVDTDTSVQACDTSTYQTDSGTYDKAKPGTKIEIPGGSKLVAFSSVTK